MAGSSRVAKSRSATQEEKDAALKRKFIAQAKAKTEKRREQEARSARIKAERAAVKAKAVKDETTKLDRIAGITPRVKQLAASGNKAAQIFLTKARGRVSAARDHLRQNPLTFTEGRGRFRVTRTSKEKRFNLGIARTIAAGESVKAFRQLFAKQTKALGRAKGAASGESIKAGLGTSQIASGGLGGFGTPSPGLQNIFRRSIEDSVSISGSGGVKVFTETKPKPENILRGGPANLIIGGGIRTKTVGVLNLTPFPFVSVEEKTIISQTDKGGIIGPPAPKQKNILEQAQTKLQAVSDSPLKFLLPVGFQTQLGVDKTILSTFAFATNIEKQLGGLITGSKVSGLTEVSKEPTSEFLGAAITAGFEGKNPLIAGGKAFLKEAKRFGPLETVGNVGVFLIPGSQGIKSLSPLKIISFEGSKLLVGSVPGKITVLLSKSPGGKIVKGFDITSIGKEKFVALTTKFNIKPKGGAEIDFLGKTQSKILTSEKSLKSLTAAGFITKGGADLIRAGKTVVKESKGLPQPIFRETFPKGSFGLSEKQLEGQIKFFKESKITLEGSSIDAFGNIPKFAIKPGDADIKVKSILEGQKLAALNLERLSPLAEKGQKFTIGGKDKTQFLLDGKKVAEFLIAGADETGQLAKKGFVLGVKTDTGTFKTAQGVKIRNPRFQTARMIASITSLQPSKVLGGPVRVGPPINPLGAGTTRAKDFPKAFARTKTEASIAATELLKGKAQKLEGAAAIIKREGSKEISFSQFFKSRAVKPETRAVKSPLEKTTVKGFKEPSLVSKISSSKTLSKSLSQSPRLTSPIRSLVSKSPRSPLSSRSPTSPRSPSIKTSFSKSLLGSSGSAFPDSPKGPSLSKLTGKPGSPTPGKPGAPSVPSKGAPISKFSDTSGTSTVLRQAKRLQGVALLIGGQLAITKPVPRKFRVDFLGSTFSAGVVGFRTKKDFDFGREKVQKIVSKELRGKKRSVLKRL